MKNVNEKMLSALLSVLAAVAVVSAEGRELGYNDVSYGPLGGKGETFLKLNTNLTTNEAARKAYWQRLEKETKPVIGKMHLRCRQSEFKRPRLPRFEDGKARIDAFFSDGKDFKACPEKFLGVTLGEESVTWDDQIPRMNALAKYLKERYHVRTYHWLTEPLKPTHELVGDGWVFDAYGVVDPDVFYAHCESFILAGGPVVPIVWAAGHFEDYHAGKTWPEMTRFTIERCDICRSLGLPVQLFAVAGKQGSTAGWFRKAADPEEQAYREAIRAYMAKATTGEKPTWRKPVKQWRVGVSRKGELAATVDLTDFELVNTTYFDDVHNWKLTKEGLTLTDAKGTLEWRLIPSGEVTEGELVLKHGKGAKGTFGGTVLSADGETRVKTGAFAEKTVSLVAEGPILLQSLAFVGKGVFKEDVIVPVMTDADSHTDYQAERRYAGDDEWFLKSVKGCVAKRRLVQKLALPGCCGTLTVTGDVLAKSANGASVRLGLSLDGTTMLTNIVSVAGKANQQMQTHCAIPTDSREAYCIWDLEVNNGTGRPETPCSGVKSVHYRLKPLKP